MEQKGYEIPDCCAFAMTTIHLNKFLFCVCLLSVFLYPNVIVIHKSQAAFFPFSIHFGDKREVFTNAYVGVGFLLASFFFAVMTKHVQI